MEADAKRVIREWNREIEEEIRGAVPQDDRRWKIVVWVVSAIGRLSTIKPEITVR
jgi:hypothetical protein